MNRLVKTIKKEEQRATLQVRKCIVCGATAGYVMKGYELNTYCRECAKESFKELAYLQKIK
jgi:ribosomal protein S14